MSTYIYFEPRARPLSPAGLTMPGSTLKFYISGTTTLATLYANPDQTAVLKNPLPSDSTGLFPVIYLDGSTTYRRLLYDPNGILLADDDPSAVPPVINPLCHVKSVSRLQTSNTILTPDPDLFSPILSAGNYSFELLLGMQGANAGNGGINILFGGGTTSWSGFAQAISYVNGSLGAANNVATGYWSQNFPLLSAPSGSVADSFHLHGGMVLTSPGTIGLSWAQNTSTAIATTVVAGSYLTITPVNG